MTVTDFDSTLKGFNWNPGDESHDLLHFPDNTGDWWRSAVIYQIYPRSFKDSNGDGIGDIPGITEGLPALKDLGVDAVWISPFYTSPQKDGGYDVSDYRNIDPVFGTLGDFDTMMAEANRIGLKVIVDIVPNHCSSEHPLFVKALSSVPGSAERDMFIFRDGKGGNGELPPNNWKSHFGGSAWTRTVNSDGTAGQWYLHLFDTSQPDFNWKNPLVQEEFEKTLRFWLGKGVTGFRVDVAHALIKKDGLPDWGGKSNGKSIDGWPGHTAPMFGQPEVHDIFRQWRKILDEYDGERILCAEANVDPVERIADWVREDEMHQAFNFSYLYSDWNAFELKEVITSSFKSFDAVNAPSTWVLSNHDKVRHVTRFGMERGMPRGSDGIGPKDDRPSLVLGTARARAASLFMLGLPGSAYLYQGEELGLPDYIDIPASKRQDPTFQRTNGERIGRDGCRVPIPWESDSHTYGFSTGRESWLPQPVDWEDYSRSEQEKRPDSTLNMYKNALERRKEMNLGAGSFTWFLDDYGYEGANVLAFENGNILVIMNMGSEYVPVPNGLVLMESRSTALLTGKLAPNSTVWLDVSK